MILLVYKTRNVLCKVTLAVPTWGLSPDGGLHDRGHAQRRALLLPAFKGFLVRLVVAHLSAYLIECKNWLVLESQLPDKIVNFLFTITSRYIELTIFGGN